MLEYVGLASHEQAPRRARARAPHRTGSDLFSVPQVLSMFSKFYNGEAEHAGAFARALMHGEPS